MSGGVETQSSTRFHELDSMRGLAALVVVFHHFHLMFYRHTFTTGWPWFFLHPFVAGHEAVMFFFVLSGFVLTLPLVRGQGQDYSIYIRRRVLRIYAPYIVALCLSVVTGFLLWKAPVTIGSLVQQFVFIGNYDFYRYNMAFWSLVYEMRISIIFPGLYLLSTWLRIRGLSAVILAFTLFGTKFDSPTWITLAYTAVFLVGILLACHIRQTLAFYARLDTARKATLLLASFLLYNESYRLETTPLWHLGALPTVLGACGLMITGLGAARARRTLNSAVPSFFGRISFSLYLVHATILLALASLLKDRMNHLLLFFVYFAMATGMSWLFYLTVERPFTIMSRSLGTRATESQTVSA